MDKRSYTAGNRGFRSLRPDAAEVLSHCLNDMEWADANRMLFAHGVGIDEHVANTDPPMFHIEFPKT